MLTPSTFQVETLFEPFLFLSQLRSEVDDV
jgi:hypothetical protein